jgi:hypothetical protein
MALLHLGINLFYRAPRAVTEGARTRAAAKHFPSETEFLLLSRRFLVENYIPPRLAGGTIPFIRRYTTI